MPNLTQARGQEAMRVTRAFKKSPEDAAKELATVILPDLTRNLLAAIKRGEGWAIRTGLEVAKMVGAQPLVVVNMLQALGVRDEAELRARVETAKRLDSLSEATADQMAEDAMAVMRQAVMRSPAILERLEAFVVGLRSVSRAEVMDETGNGVPLNGSGH